VRSKVLPNTLNAALFYSRTSLLTRSFLFCTGKRIYITALVIRRALTEDSSCRTRQNKTRSNSGKWITDPDNPTTIGGGNYTNSILAVNPNYTFRVKGFSNAKSVSISGSFNGWNRDGFRLKKTSSGWEIPLYLKPGKYTYKLIVDGEWILDPDNKLWEQNEFGTGNSVVWINP